VFDVAGMRHDQSPLGVFDHRARCIHEEISTPANGLFLQGFEEGFPFTGGQTTDRQLSTANRTRSVLTAIVYLLFFYKLIY
jgi:hypothetical protein